jgi:hypothetical protein
MCRVRIGTVTERPERTAQSYRRFRCPPLLRAVHRALQHGAELDAISLRYHRPRGALAAALQGKLARPEGGVRGSGDCVQPSIAKLTSAGAGKRGERSARRGAGHPGTGEARWRRPLEIMLLAADAERHLIEKSFIARFWPTPLQRIGEQATEAQAPVAGVFVTDHQATSGEGRLAIMQAEAEAVI